MPPSIAFAISPPHAPTGHIAGVVATAACALGTLLATMIGLQTGRSPIATRVRTIGQGPRGSLLLYATLLDLSLVAAVVAVAREEATAAAERIPTRAR